MILTLEPLSENLETTLDSISSVLGILMGSKKARELDAGQFEMLREAKQRIEQVGSELGAYN